MTGRPCIFGEVLFDQFPDGRRVLGGAPFNVAWHLQAFGEEPFLVSRVGRDGDADAIRSAMREWNMDLSGLQTDERLPTGRVEVRVEHGEPSYDIVHPAAWDAIEPSVECPPASLLYHGSLALREEASRRAWQGLRNRQPGIVFIDVNLRSPWWRRDRVLADLGRADWLKLNREELDRLAPGSAPARSRAEALLDAYGLQALLLTDGARGAELLTRNGDYLASRPPPTVEVVDTVGAGDALAAVMLVGILRRWPLEVSLERAQYFASMVVGQRGATVPERGFYAPCIDEWPGHTAEG